MKKVVKGLSVLLMAIMVLMTFTACSKKDKDETETKDEGKNNIKDIKIGDIYTFGAYEQDNNTSNGKEAIEWIVVDKEGASLCLVSKYALDCQQYNTYSSISAAWKTCSLREWLNNTFIDDAFSSEEQSMIVTTTVTTDETGFGINPGNHTQDKVFLLSETEAKKYFSSDDARMCVPTEYAIARGAETRAGSSTGGRGPCWWWVRTHAADMSNYAPVVLNNGFVRGNGRDVDDDIGAVRPALWITSDANSIKKIGDIYTFGAYEQDNNPSNGKEAIEWIVVGTRGASLCLVSKYVLDSKPYNTSPSKVTWETCSLREWLNNTFINDAFSSEEQAMIVTTTVAADKNPTDIDANPGNYTRDRIFLLSIVEAEEYFSSDDVRMCAPTDYAIVQGALIVDRDSTGGRATCAWWLRSPSYGNFRAAYVNYDGGISNGYIDFAAPVDSEGCGVRPALWITPES